MRIITVHILALNGKVTQILSRTIIEQSINIPTIGFDNVVLRIVVQDTNLKDLITSSHP